ncbi:MAG: hypothetical protein C0410_00035 [Anaerolinea sp.]|nr:hypothetical protein [Anaerolinea sp.]
MTEQIYSQLEQELGALYASAPLTDTFINSLKFQLNSKVRVQSGPQTRTLRLQPAWIALIVLLAAVILTTLIIGPDKVYAEMRRLLGYIPDVGLVDTNVPIRVLAEPVEQTRYGVTITVTSATLTADRSHIEYRVFGVPRSAYPNDESVIGCIVQDYLLLPDGSKLEWVNDFPAIPMGVNDATLVIPCISGTMPGYAPENWEFPLKFVPAPTDLTVMPVIEITSTAVPTPKPVSLSQPTEIVQDNSVSVTQVIETVTGYILVGEFKPQKQESEFIQTTGMPVITDAKGLNVPLKINLDAMNNIDAGPDGWVYEIDTVGVSFPITITFSGVSISQPEPGASVEIPFVFGSTVVPGQEWKPELEFDLAGHSIKLATILANSQGGYHFTLLVDSSVNGLSVQLKDQKSIGGGGGSGLINGELNTGLSFAQLPVGKQTLVFSKLSVISDPLSWSGSWSPNEVHTDMPAVGELPAGTCGNANTIQSAPVLPATIKGKALTYEQITDSSMGGLVLSDLNGTGRTVITFAGNWGAMNTTGTRISFSAEDGLAIYDVANGTTSIQTSGSGFDPAWSNEGNRYAYVSEAADGILVMDLATGKATKVSSLAFEFTVGWLPDDSRLITAAMFSGGTAWQIRSINPESGESEDLFVIEDGSYKSLGAALSPDGKWIAYRGRNNSDIRLVNLDGSENLLVFDNPSVATSGPVWASKGWLGFSLLQVDNSHQKTILVNPVTCTVYELSGLKGTLEGFIIE